MRAALRDRVGQATPDHVGLGYDRWAPIDGATGKIPDKRRRAWLEELAAKEVSEDYRAAYERWVEAFKGEASHMVVGQLGSRLLVGHGNPSPTEVGLTVHHTWGVPVIPGSALKGLLNHYVDAAYGPSVTGIHPMAPDFPDAERDRAPFRGVTWAGRRIEHGPGTAHRALFGAPRANSDPLFVDLGAGETSGLVVFHDALFVPGSAAGHPFATDVLTVHQKSYYDTKGKKGGPNDFEDPVPVAFLTVRPGTRFLLALSGPPEWTRLAMGLLREALADWGVGGKTSSGYGCFSADKWENEWPEEVGRTVNGNAAPAAAQGGRSSGGGPEGNPAVVDELGVWLSTDTPTLREKLVLLRSVWLPRLLSATAADRREAARLIRKKYKKDHLAAERDSLLAELGEAPAGGPGEPA